MRKRLSSLYIEVYIGKIKKSSAKQQKTVVLWHIYKGWCIIIVKNADEIAVMGNSGIIEKGSHDELIESGGEYSTLHKISSF